jgi:two-component system chemotaxis response regulator CheB
VTVRVFVVDDSAVSRGCLREVLELGGRIEVVGEAADPRVALDQIAALAPDLVTMDLHMPGMGGLPAIERLMATHPVPILVVTERPSAGQTDIVFEATRRGALDLAAKPGEPRSASASALRDLVELLARVPVIHHATRSVADPPLVRPRSRETTRPKVVGVGASAGGPSALVDLLSPLARSGMCFAVVQHIPDGFADSFASFIGGSTGLRVVVARSSVTIAADLVILAPDGAHMKASGDAFLPDPGPPVGGHRPSVDVLFHSLARTHGPRAAGVILSGIGRDGAEGLQAMRRAGARTFAQDEASAVVFGMPGAARQLDAAEELLSPSRIASRLAALHGRSVS